MSLILKTKNINKKKFMIPSIMLLKIKNEKNSSILILILFFILFICWTIWSRSKYITFDPRTIGMQIDDTIMQKNLSARLRKLL